MDTVKRTLRNNRVLRLNEFIKMMINLHKDETETWVSTELNFLLKNNPVAKNKIYFGEIGFLPIFAPSKSNTLS
jgi:hypothetical protein